MYKRQYSPVIWLIILLLPLTLLFTACDISKYKSKEVQNLFKTTIENQIDSTTGINTMFRDNHTINVVYTFDIYNVTVNEESSKNMLNLFTLNNVYNKLFSAIFKYYEDWHENFFEYADSRLSAEEFTNLYNKLNAINISLRDLSSQRDILETYMSDNMIEDIPSVEFGKYLFALNNTVEKSLNFNIYFRDLHLQKIFKDTSMSYNTVLRTMDDMLLSLAQIIYIDNIKPFNIINGELCFCDLDVLIKAYLNNNYYSKIDYLNMFNAELSNEVKQALGNGENLELINKVNKYLYYSNVLRQDILTLNSISSNIDYYTLSMYRFGQIDGGISIYESTLTDLEKTTYEFLTKIELFIANTYFPAFNELTA